jgi:hypothetical protein
VTLDQARLPPDVASGIRRSAGRVVGAVIVGVVAFYTAISFRLPWLLPGATLIGPIVELGLIRALHRGMSTTDRRVALGVTTAGLAGVLIQILSSVILLTSPGSLAGTIGSAAAGSLVGIWCIGLGLATRRSRMLSHPLPRRAILGGAGLVVLAISGLLDSSLLSPGFIVGAILAVNFLGFLFGLTEFQSQPVGPPSIEPQEAV